ncbi:sterol desaturase family protein [Cohnella thailandensis]|uniref:Sterol desaturase family protein n=1 Tax=Cohnella thailandensis TaxID=557557 RepID=A0A841SUC4_9BACL|nr:sterol desaturase family protein [Cohnella thailandensis]MBB6633635.1 sterol desaturase family protein [Cohnella thailandensis]MBP1976420.1 sterol desaturase/sphingolipid hydroxylase (fatty acid hydroxylase superfamily) [Cohnella thailandensis]
MKLAHREFWFNPMIAFILGTGLAALALAVAGFQGTATVLCLAGGAVVYAIFEYLVHRFLLHRFPRIAPAMHRGHAEHHRHPTELEHLFSPIRYDAVLYLGYSLANLAIFRDWRLASAVVAGSALFQLYYQWMHYAAHRPIKLATPWGRWMRKKHLLHHYLDEQSWYGVSHPVMDYLFGTSKPQSKKGKDAGQKRA